MRALSVFSLMAMITIAGSTVSRLESVPHSNAKGPQCLDATGCWVAADGKDQSLLTIYSEPGRFAGEIWTVDGFGLDHPVRFFAHCENGIFVVTLEEYSKVGELLKQTTEKWERRGDTLIRDGKVYSAYTCP